MKITAHDAGRSRRHSTVDVLHLVTSQPWCTTFPSNHSGSNRSMDASNYFFVMMIYSESLTKHLSVITGLGKAWWSDSHMQLHHRIYKLRCRFWRVSLSPNASQHRLHHANDRFSAQLLFSAIRGWSWVSGWSSVAQLCLVIRSGFLQMLSIFWSYANVLRRNVSTMVRER